MKPKNNQLKPVQQHLVNLDPTDSCGVGCIVNMNGIPDRRVLELGLCSLSNVIHRGAVGADGKTGDGAGVSVSIPSPLMKRWLNECGCSEVPATVGVGMFLLPQDPHRRNRMLEIVSQAIRRRGLAVLGIREVPMNSDALGCEAIKSQPYVAQLFVASRDNDEEKFERELYLVRRSIELTPTESSAEFIHVASFSCRTIVYKGMVLSSLLGQLYPDLTNENFVANFCIYHQRFSTNTSPEWALCQPFRMLGHNGEINTIRGNRNWMTSREPTFYHKHWSKSDRKLLTRLFSFNDSDSASLDNALEVLTLSGRSLTHTLSMLIPPAWQNDPRVPPEQRAFFDFHGCFSEPWDGPAAVVATDGLTIAACLDRNGLRPARYCITDDGLFVLGSEIGAARLVSEKIKRRGRLGPGQMIAVDTSSGQIHFDHEIKESLAKRRPYEKWLQENQTTFHPTRKSKFEHKDFDPETCLRHQIAAGLTREELEVSICKMAEDGVEPTFSMGVDTPLAVLSRHPRNLADYFKQRFAQVTNPPIDPIREKSVMSISAELGPERNLLSESPLQCRVFKLNHPVLLPSELKQIESQSDFRFHTIDCTWASQEGPTGLERKIRQIIDEALLAVESQATVLILSDRLVDTDKVPVPMLLAVGAVHHALQKASLRLVCSLVAETSAVRDAHQLALMFGYGCTAVDPYLAYQSVHSLMVRQKLVEPETGCLFEQYRTALEKGLYKIMSKMGISVLNSYQGAQVFEAVGLGPGIIDTCFKYSYSNLGGAEFEDIATDCLVRHHAAFQTDAPDLKINDMGLSKPKRRGEHHVINGKVTKSVHTFAVKNQPQDFDDFRELVTLERPVALRDLLRLTPVGSGPISVDQVEPIESIRTRFTTAAMSLGAISPEAHEAIAIAMNTIGGKSNSGEGGEDPARFTPRENGEWANSKIKQIASGRFGVDPEYLSHATELEIKMAQGAKPGEGGQLPGFKVNGLIAQLRNTDPGVTLISPPPHHDIYSIEDLAQLIHDLKMVNPRARVSVKLVAKTGVGGIAVGAVKAKADTILISGHEGGTGASPLTSIKHAGIPWELGLAEAHQSLAAAGLRDRTVLRVDGGLRTGRDVIHAAILGAEEFNFGTMALIALGCVYVKKCHLNNCPVGIATQDPKYRAKFKGKPENLINYLNGVAQDARTIMAQLGIQSVDELIGKTTLLTPTSDPANPKSKRLRFTPLLANPVEPVKTTSEKYFEGPNTASGFDDQILTQLSQNEFRDANEMALTPVSFDKNVCNTDRNIGTRLSGELCHRFGKNKTPPNKIQLNLTGTAGQSLGAFLTEGIAIRLTGDTNDYAGKGMCGGLISIRPPKRQGYASHENVVAGNTLLYGATGGKLFASGIVGERLCIRNSGATAVVEGCGDHGCEYMTKGLAVILGTIGNNFGAGMTGGSALLYSPNQNLSLFCNLGSIQLTSLNEQDLQDLREVLKEFVMETESGIARELIANWEKSERLFVKAIPR